MLRILLFAALAFASTARATDVEGFISQDTTWTLAGSPYRVIGNLTVGSTATLTIEPGVVVEVADVDQSGVTMRVRIIGFLIAEGTAAAPIQFRALNAGTQWSGLAFQSPTRQSRLRHVSIRDAWRAIDAFGTSAVVATDVDILDVTRGVDMRANGQTTFTRVRVTNASEPGFHLEGLQVELVDCSVDDAEFGFRIMNASARLRGGRVVDAETDGIAVTGGHLEVERFQAFGNRNGISATGAQVSVRNSVFAGNDESGLSLRQTGNVPIDVLNVTVDSNGVGPEGVSDLSTGIYAEATGENFVIRNAIVTNHRTGFKGSGPVVLSHNNLWNNDEDYVNVSGPGISENPQYVQPPVAFDYASADYRLGPNSLVIDRGHGDAPATDADGFSRPYDGNADGTAAPDPGAYEWHPPVAPVAVGAHDRLARIDASIQFDATGSYDPDGFIASYLWDFGGGDTSSEAIVERTFDALGPYEITLTLTDGDGLTTTETFTVTVVENVPPEAAAGADRHVKPGEAVTLSGAASSDPDGTLTAYQWDFGDGSPVETGLSVTHAWTAQGIYAVTLTVTDSLGSTDTDQLLVAVTTADIAPVARAGGAREVLLGTALDFDGSDSTDADGSIVSWEWDFGDGAGATGATASHTFLSPGSYVVTLRVTDDDGFMDEDSVRVTVTQPSNAAPVASAGESRTVLLGEAVTLSGAASTDPDGALTFWSWELGDGATATGESVTHTYQAEGAYAVSLTVTDDDGATAHDVIVVTVRRSDNAPPVASAGEPQQLTLGKEVALSGADSSDADGTIVSWSWDLGDGNAASGERVSHTYEAAGVYAATLTVTDDRGATAYDVVLVTVTEPQQGCAAVPGAANALYGVLAALFFARRRHRRTFER